MGILGPGVRGSAPLDQSEKMPQIPLDAKLEHIERANPIHQPELGISDRRKELVEEKGEEGKSIRERDHNRSWRKLGHTRERSRAGESVDKAKESDLEGIKQTGEEAKKKKDVPKERKSKLGRENKPWDERLESNSRRKKLLDLSSTSVVTLDSLVSKLDEIKQIDIEKQLDERLVAGKMLERKLRQVAQETRDLEEILYSLDKELEIKKDQLKHNEQIVLQYLGHNPSTWDEQQMEDRIRNLSHLQRKIAIAQALKIIKQQKKIEGPSENNNMCMICCERPKNARLSPCGHALCDLCAAMINKCPNCRTQITERQPLYL